jgi:hypothetical protein
MPACSVEKSIDEQSSGSTGVRDCHRKAETTGSATPAKAGDGRDVDLAAGVSTFFQAAAA